MVHRAMPTLLRELAAPFANDPDYEALQTTPAATIFLINGGGGSLGLFVVADDGGVPVQGTYSLQPIEDIMASGAASHADEHHTERRPRSGDRYLGELAGEVSFNE